MAINNSIIWSSGPNFVIRFPNNAIVHEFSTALKEFGDLGVIDRVEFNENTSELHVWIAYCVGDLLITRLNEFANSINIPVFRNLTGDVNVSRVGIQRVVVGRIVLCPKCGATMQKNDNEYVCPDIECERALNRQ